MVDDAVFIGKPDFKSTIDAVRMGKVDTAVLPIENSTTGSIFEVYDLLLENKLSIVQEGILKINHLLLAKRADTKTCYCHPEAYKQCQKVLLKMGIKPIFVEDTATAVKTAKSDKEGKFSAIGNTFLAQFYGLKIISDSIQTSKENYTRFFAIERQDTPGVAGMQGFPGGGGNKVTIVFSVVHQPGSLLDALKPYKEYGLNLTKIESRPISGKPWEYIFIVDILLNGTRRHPEGNRHTSIPPEWRDRQRILKAVIDDMKKNTTFLKILGTYPKGKTYAA